MYIRRDERESSCVEDERCRSVAAVRRWTWICHGRVVVRYNVRPKGGGQGAKNAAFITPPRHDSTDQGLERDAIEKTPDAAQGLLDARRTLSSLSPFPSPCTDHF